MAPAWGWHSRIGQAGVFRLSSFYSLTLRAATIELCLALPQGCGQSCDHGPVVQAPWLPHMKNKVCAPRCRDMVMDGRGFTLPRLLKLSSSPLLGSRCVGDRLLGGPWHAWLCTSLLPDGQTQGGTHGSLCFSTPQ